MPKVTVETCKPSLTSYPTISAGVAAVPAGSIVDVCPGTYPEQLFIRKRLTLEGIISGNAGRVVITVPASGLAVVIDPVSGDFIAAMVTVSASPVTIKEITVDGTGNTVGATGGGPFLVGIYYASGTSGTAQHVTARNLTTGTYRGFGMWAENESGTNELVTISGNSIHDFDGSGIYVVANHVQLHVVEPGQRLHLGGRHVLNSNHAQCAVNSRNRGCDPLAVRRPSDGIRKSRYGPSFKR